MKSYLFSQLFIKTTKKYEIAMPFFPKSCINQNQTLWGPALQIHVNSVHTTPVDSFTSIVTSFPSRLKWSEAASFSADIMFVCLCVKWRGDRARDWSTLQCFHIRCCHFAGNLLLPADECWSYNLAETSVSRSFLRFVEHRGRSRSNGRKHTHTDTLNLLFKDTIYTY